MSDARSAYLLVGMTRSGEPDQEDIEGTQKYQELGGKAMERAGVTIGMVATGSTDPANKMEVLEGSYPYQAIAIERFPSLEGLETFWFSEEYQEAIKIRQQLKSGTLHFVAVLEGTPLDEQGEPPADGVLAYSVTCPPAASEFEGYDLKKYSEIAGGIDRGYKPQLIAQVTSAQELRLLEGEWPFPGGVIVRAHPSVQTLVDYWQNPVYIEARKNRPELAMQAIIPGFVMPE